jgi:bifunctional enzyme CysN/CysC
MRAPLAVCLAGHVDHGKSSLLGRLLHELDLLPDGKVAALEAASAARGVPLEWSFALDALQVERDQAITIDTTRVRVATPKRAFIVIDAPGHAQLVRNMVTAAAGTDAALVVVDVAAGAQAQTRQHLALLRLLGVRNVVVAVNKMDTVDWNGRRFEEVRDDVGAALAKLGLDVIGIVPVSAREGANLVVRAKAAWWTGPTLVEALESLPDTQSADDGPLRMPVQDVYRSGERRVVAGRLSSGSLRAGDEVLALPSGARARVVEFAGWPSPPSSFEGGDNASIVLDRPLVIERGELLCDPSSPPKLTAVFDAELFWLGAGELGVGRRLRVRVGTREVGAYVSAIVHVQDGETFAPHAAAAIPEGGIARVTVRCDSALAVDDFASVRDGARFVLIDGGAIAGGGVLDASGYPDLRRAPAVGDHRTPVRHEVTAVERSARVGHSGAIVWLTGLSGAGKSTLAMALERRLFDLGWNVYTLDGDNVRRGLNADLGFAPEDRQENIRRVGEVATLFADAGAVCIAAFISPYRDDRRRARAAAGARRFIEVFVRSPLAVCEARDPKGLYAKARRGEVRGFTGVDSPYEPPESPELVIDTDANDVDACVAKLFDFVVAACRS